MRSPRRLRRPALHQVHRPTKLFPLGNKADFTASTRIAIASSWVVCSTAYRHRTERSGTLSSKYSCFYIGFSEGVLWMEPQWETCTAWPGAGYRKCIYHACLPSALDRADWGRSCTYIEMKPDRHWHWKEGRSWLYDRDGVYIIDSCTSPCGSISVLRFHLLREALAALPAANPTPYPGNAASTLVMSVPGCSRFWG